MGLFSQTNDDVWDLGEERPLNLPTQGLRLVPSDVLLWAAGGSVLLSLGLRLLGRRDDSLFVGEWAPTLVSLGVLARMVES